MKVISSLILGLCIVAAAYLVAKALPSRQSSGAPIVGSAPDKKLDFSDLSLVSDDTYLVVSDYKIPVHPGYRVSLLTISEEDMIQVPIPVPDWKDPDGAPSDLEASCPVPGRANEFLIAESSVYKGKFGRIFHVTLGQGHELTPSLVVNGVMRIYDRPLDEEKSAYSGDQVEGMVCFQTDQGLILAYGERGGDTANGSKPGTIVWGELDLSGYQFKKVGEAPLVNRSILGGRDCGSLQLISTNGEKLSVASVATNDPGEDGPFESVIYRAGKFSADSSGAISFTALENPQILSRLSGLKVEGLAAPAKIVPDSTFMISTDDEAFGAILRPVKVDKSLFNP